MFFPLAMLSQYIFGPALFSISLFIVLIILLQRGRGGGLTGALGGAGGASAFGVKAGDIFTRITAVSVLLWIVLCALMCYWYLPAKLNIQSDPGSMSASGGTGAVLSSDTGLLGDPGFLNNLGLPGNAIPDVPGTEIAVPLPDPIPPKELPAAAGSNEASGLPPVKPTSNVDSTSPTEDPPTPATTTPPVTTPAITTPPVTAPPATNEPATKTETEPAPIETPKAEPTASKP